MTSTEQCNLATFERELRAAACDSTGWPFLCDGSPFDCQIFVVGINPASDMSLWPFWSNATGVNRKAWLEAYRKKYGRIRPTRHRINWLVEAAKPARVLETNIFSSHSRRERDLRKHLRTSEVFDFLIDKLKPKIMFVHGRSTIRYIERVMSTVLHHGEFKILNYRGMTMHVLSNRHLYNWKRIDVEQLGRALRDRLVAVHS